MGRKVREGKLERVGLSRQSLRDLGYWLSLVLGEGMDLKGAPPDIVM